MRDLRGCRGTRDLEAPGATRVKRAPKAPQERLDRWDQRATQACRDCQEPWGHQARWVPQAIAALQAKPVLRAVLPALGLNTGGDIVTLTVANFPIVGATDKTAIAVLFGLIAAAIAAAGDEEVTSLPLDTIEAVLGALGSRGAVPLGTRLAAAAKRICPGTPDKHTLCPKRHATVIRCAKTSSTLATERGSLTGSTRA